MPKLQLTLRKLFLIDALGAALSAFLLGVVLVHYESIFGIPAQVLYLLAAFPVVFAIYDLICYFGVKKNLPGFLIAIALTNLGYCILSITLASLHYESITLFGYLYIAGEIAIVVVLAILEIKMAFKSKSSPTPANRA